MLARSGLVGKRTSRPYLGPSGPIFCVGRKNPKNPKILLIFLGGHIDTLCAATACASADPSQKFGTQKNQKNKNSQNQNPFCPKCRQYFFKPEKNLPGPIWGPPGTFFAWAEKIQNLQTKCLFSLVGQWALFTRFGVMCWCHLNQSQGGIKKRNTFTTLSNLGAALSRSNQQASTS